MIECRTLREWKIMTTCNICGQEYGLKHSCAGIAPLGTPEEQAPPPHLRFAPGYYFQQAFNILTWDGAAVRPASRDNNSLVYGLLMVAIGTALPFGLLLLRNWGLGYTAPWRLIGAQHTLVLIYSLLWIVLQIGFLTCGKGPLRGQGKLSRHHARLHVS